MSTTGSATELETDQRSDRQANHDRRWWILAVLGFVLLKRLFDDLRGRETLAAVRAQQIGNQKTSRGRHASTIPLSNRETDLQQTTQQR